MAKTGVQRTTEWRKRKAERERAEMQDVLNILLDDVDIIVTAPKDGKQRVTFDMGKDTAAALAMVAEAQGKTLDAIMRGAIETRLQEAAKLRIVKDRHDRQTKIAELRADQERIRQELADLADMQKQFGGSE